MAAIIRGHDAADDCDDDDADDEEEEEEGEKRALWPLFEGILVLLLMILRSVESHSGQMETTERSLRG